MKANYELMLQTYDQLNSLVDDMLANVREAKSVIEKMDYNDHWDGKGYNNFNKKFNNLSQNFGAYCNELYQLNNTICQVVNSLKSVDKKVTSR